ncbi:MAG: flagellar protein FlgN [Alphaproteobacteria bacterium]|nr:flagellar protein FlgN [Alphaproteobacteria bacterium]
MQNQTHTPSTESTTAPPAPKALRLSRDPNKAINEMMVTIDALRNSLVEETNALNEADTQTFMSLQDNKLHIAGDYLEGMSQLLARKDELKSADPKLKKRLEEMRKDFADIAHENHAALQRMQNGMKRLGERIMEKAKEAAKKEKQIIYGASGHMKQGLKASIGVNESV